MIIDKHAISRNFSDASNTYDLWARPQQTIAKRLIELSSIKEDKLKILDVGCGTGNMIEQMRKNNLSSSFLGIDIAPGMIDFCKKHWNQTPKFRFKKCDIRHFNTLEKYNLILSSCTLQWLETISDTIKKLSDFLEPDGTLGIAVLIRGSFFELSSCYKTLFNDNLPGPQYEEKEYYIDAVKENNLKVLSAKVEVVKAHFEGLDILKYFKYIGATFKHNIDYSPLSITNTKKLIEHYMNNFGHEKRSLPVTHKILYLIAKK